MRKYQGVLFVAMALSVGGLASAPVAASSESAGISADKAQRLLVDGNARYVSQSFFHPNQTLERRTAVAQSQAPFAVIVSCSDSRVPPEVIFDRGVGDLFVVRVAGNVVDDVAIGSIEYAAEHLGAQLIMVLGHKRCGAVSATVKGQATAGHLPAIAAKIAPAVERSKGQSGDLVDNAVRENVLVVMETLSASEPVLKEAVEKGKVRIVGAYYDLDSGEVKIASLPEDASGPKEVVAEKAAAKEKAPMVQHAA
ncbi:MAG: carbonic anhydrase [Candidatus Omnitrophota bacterium]